MKKLATFVLWREACRGNDYSQWTPQPCRSIPPARKTELKHGLLS